MRKEKITGIITTVTAELDLLQLENGAFGLGVKPLVVVPGMDRAKAEDLVNKAHAICPYSNAKRGNIEVKLEIK